MWIQVSSGRGPAECERAVTLFVHIFLMPYLHKRNITSAILEIVKGVENETAKSILLSIEGDTEECTRASDELSGSIQWIQKSPFRKHHGRKNWFISCSVIEEPSRYNFSEKDIRIDLTRSSGPGGQNVNKVETAVRITHLPSGISVFASEERSQKMNRRLAMARLEKALMALQEKKEEERKRNSWMQHNSLERGNPRMIFSGMNFKKVK